MQDTPVGIPETKYAWNGDVALAYQVFGDGPVDLVYVEGYASHVDMNWESPRFARFLKGLARHARLIVTDRRGYGCSDRFSPFDIPASETIVDDVFAVMDAVGSDRAAIFATNWSGFAAQAAASHPDRVAALILESPIVTWIATDETPVGVTSEHLDWVAEEVRANWGSPAFPRGAEQDQAEKDWFVRWQRASISPGSLVAEVRRWKETDVRRILPSIHVPTLVIVDPDASELWDPENGRYVATKIPGAKLVEVPRGFAMLPWWGNADAIVDEIGRFLVGIGEEQATFGRVLATVMFTDIVDSTIKAVELGDREWKQLVEQHHAFVRAFLSRFRGREIDTAGDGFFASFDGPARAIRCATAISEAVRDLGVDVRAGLHAGECELIDGKLGGLGVVIGARIGALAGPNEVLVSQTVKDLVVGSGFSFLDAGEHELKGVPDRWRLYRVAG